MKNLFFNYYIIIKRNLRCILIVVIVWRIFVGTVYILSSAYGLDTGLIPVVLIEFLENINTLKTKDGYSYLDSKGMLQETADNNDKTPSTPVDD